MKHLRSAPAGPRWRGNDHEGIDMTPGYNHGTVYVSTVPVNPTVGEYLAARITEGGALEPRFTLATKGKVQQRAVF